MQHRRGRGASGMSGDGVKVTRQQDCSSWKVIGWWDAGARTRMRDCEREVLYVLDVDERGRVGMIGREGREMCVLHRV